MMFTKQKFKQYSEIVAKSAAVALIFFIPLSNSMTTVCSVIFLISCLFTLDQQKLQIAFKHPVTRAILILLGLYGLGLLYSIGTEADQLQTLRKMSRLLFIPLLLLIFYQASWRRYAILAYLTGVTILVTMQMFIPGARIKDSIFTSLFVVCAIFFLGHHLIDKPRYKWLIVPLIVLFTYYLMFISFGRTGQILLLALFTLFCWQRFGLNIKKQILALTLLIALIATAIILPSSFSTRQATAATEVQNFIQDRETSLAKSSMGLRMAFAQNAIKLVELKPIFGWGTGGFPQAYLKTFPDAKHNSSSTVNPHNQYLLTAAELGLVGLFSLLYLFFRLARGFWITKTPDARLGLGLIFAVAIGCLANSWLLDFASMFFFVTLTGVLLGSTR